MHLVTWLLVLTWAQSAGAVAYADCISVEGKGIGECGVTLHRLYHLATFDLEV